jgi:hypothetical protein
MARINPIASAKLNGGRLIALRVLAEKFDLDPLRVFGWARRRGVRGHRLTTISLGGWRYTTIQEFNQFVADVNGWSQPCEKGPYLSFCLGVLPYIVDTCPCQWLPHRKRVRD